MLCMCQTQNVWLNKPWTAGQEVVAEKNSFFIFSILIRFFISFFYRKMSSIFNIINVIKPAFLLIITCVKNVTTNVSNWRLTLWQNDNFCLILDGSINFLVTWNYRFVNFYLLRTVLISNFQLRSSNLGPKHFWKFCISLVLTKKS